MLLSDEALAGFLRKQNRRLLSVLPLLALLSSCAKAGPVPGCFLDVPVYGAKGDRLPFSISAVNPEGDGNINLLDFPQREYRVEADGDRLYFQPALIGKRRLQLVLKNEQGAKVVTRVALMHCQQRMSVEYGGITEGLGTGDVRWSVINGRITGCKLLGDWWIRAVPMFGSQDSPVIHEGLISLSDGAFSIASTIHGERHIIVIGKDKEPLKVLGFNAAEGGKNDIGIIDMRDSCPK